MEELIVRRIRTADNEEIIELDLNRSMRSPRRGYASYMDDIERLSAKPEKKQKEFITVLQ